MLYGAIQTSSRSTGSEREADESFTNNAELAVPGALKKEEERTRTTSYLAQSGAKGSQYFPDQ